MHFTLKTNPLRYEDLRDFAQCYNPENRQERKETDRFRSFSYDELVQWDKANLDIFWLKDESLEDLENLPEPEVLAREIAESLQSALYQFRGVCEDLGGEAWIWASNRRLPRRPSLDWPCRRPTPGYGHL